MSALPGLPLPNLDDRRWSDLVEEGRTLIPLYAPEWTDHNLHDPGITLIELFAWLTEQDFFRIDRIGAEQIRKLLSLAGVTPAPPRPARVVLSVTPGQSLPTAVISPGTEFSGTTTAGQLVRFRAVDQTVATAAKLVAFQVEQQGLFLDRTRYLDRGEPFAPWGDDPAPGSAFLLGFDNPLPDDAWITLHFTVRDPDDSDAERERLRGEALLSSLQPDRLRNEARVSSLEQPVHHSVRLAWEAQTASGLWVPLRVSDETRALTLNGRVRLRGSTLSAGNRIGRVETPLYYIRVRIISGSHDQAPRLLRLIVNGVLAEQALVPAKAKRDDQPIGYLQDHPALAGLRFESLDKGDGWPGQIRTVSEAPIAGGRAEIVTHEGDRGKPPDRWVCWSIRPDFDASGRADAHVVLDPQRGTLTFGDGESGRALPEGAVLYVAYMTTRAGAGNVPAGTVTAVRDDAPGAAAQSPGKPSSPIGQVVQPQAAWGGRDLETQDQVLRGSLTGLTRSRGR